MLLLSLLLQLVLRLILLPLLLLLVILLLLLLLLLMLMVSVAMLQISCCATNRLHWAVLQSISRAIGAAATAADDFLLQGTVSCCC